MTAGVRINSKILNRSDDTAGWEKVKDIQTPLKGEICIEFTPSGDTLLKVGTGTHLWSKLDYLVEPIKDSDIDTICNR